MRLFTAITFSDEIKSKLYQTTVKIKDNCASGNFSRKENYHITLVFLGDTDQNRVDDIKDIINNTAEKFTPFTLSILDVGYFKKGNRKILYYKVGEETEVLSKLEQMLYRDFFKYGMCRNQESYTPHMTFARQVKTDKIPNTNQNIKFIAEKITLMHSTRVDNVLTYIPIYSAGLGKKE